MGPILSCFRFSNRELGSLLSLAILASACGADGGKKPKLSPDAGDGGAPPGAEEDASAGPDMDAGFTASDASDAADAAEEIEPPPEADWDAAILPSGPPIGYAYVEKKGTFALKEPAALAAAFNVLAADTQDVRLFYNGVESSDAGIEVDYGAVFVDDAGARASYQYPDDVGNFQLAPSVADPLTFVSRPFDYHLLAWVPAAGRKDVGYKLELAATQATWVAKFSEDFARIDEGSLSAAVLRGRAEAAPFVVDALTCFLVCSDITKCGGGLKTLSDLLDCNAAKPGLDTDGDGTKDAYRLRIEFSSERIAPQ